MKNPYKLAIIISIAGVLFIVLCSSALAIKNAPGIAYGIYSDGLELSGLDEQAARELLDNDFKEKTAGSVIVLKAGNKIQTITAADIDLSCDSAAAAEAAAKVGTSGSFLPDTLDKLICTYRGKNIPLEINYNENKLDAIVQKLSGQLYIKPVSAYCYIEGSSVKPVKEKIGQKADAEQLKAVIDEKIKTMNYPQTIDVPVIDITPAVTGEKLEHIDTVLASYATGFNIGEANRSDNIALAAKNLSGTLVDAGAEFSFNETVGPRLAAAGYRDAPVIIDGKVVPGIGGGVCQVSSTLYDAILLAGLVPVERTAHYFPAGYVPRPFDATVADGLIDFRFRNNLRHGIYILALPESGRLSVFILGSSEDRPQYNITLKNHYNNDGSVSAYRIFSQNGAVVKNEFLHTDK